MGNLQLSTRAYPFLFFNNFKFLKSKNRLCPSFNLLRNLIIHLDLTFPPKLRENERQRRHFVDDRGHCTLIADSILVGQPIRLQHLH